MLHSRDVKSTDASFDAFAGFILIFKSPQIARCVVPLHVYAGTGLARSSQLFIPRGCFMNNIIYIVGVIVIVIAVLSFFGFR
jgi:hypothetical protein